MNTLEVQIKEMKEKYKELQKQRKRIWMKEYLEKYNKNLRKKL